MTVSTEEAKILSLTEDDLIENFRKAVFRMKLPTIFGEWEEFHPGYQIRVETLNILEPEPHQNKKYVTALFAYGDSIFKKNYQGFPVAETTIRERILLWVDDYIPESIKDNATVSALLQRSLLSLRVLHSLVAKKIFQSLVETAFIQMKVFFTNLATCVDYLTREIVAPPPEPEPLPPKTKLDNLTVIKSIFAEFKNRSLDQGLQNNLLMDALVEWGKSVVSELPEEKRMYFRRRLKLITARLQIFPISISNVQNANKIFEDLLKYSQNNIK